MPQVKGQGENSILFPEDSDADLNFDLPAAVFYLASRYEEYHCASTDAHGVSNLPNPSQPGINF